MTSCPLPPTALLSPSSGGEWLALALSYLLGAVPFGLVMAKVLRGIDLREIGSGNIGATNTMRALGKPLGVLAFGLDFGKGWLPAAVLAPALSTDAEGLLALRVLCGAAAVLGHCFPLYLGFRGGKGVATGCGALVAIDPLIFVVGGLVWLASMATTRFTGLSSMLMGVTFAVVAWFRSDPGARAPFYGALALALLIVVRHRANVRRMLAGTEPRAGKKPAGGSSTQPGGMR